MNPRRITPYIAARGLGAAGHGTSHWRAQRVSAVALVPLTIWLVLSLASGAATDYAALIAWFARPTNMILMILLLIAAFHHAALGLQVIAEDYIHSRMRFVVITLLQLACIGGATASIAATLILALMN